MTNDCTYQITDNSASEKNNCTVRALVNAFGVSYDTAYYKLAAFGRKHDKGLDFGNFLINFQTERIMKGNIRYHGELFGVKFTSYSRPGMTVRTFVKKHPTGIFIARYRGHVFTVKDGIIFDSFKTPVNKVVLNYYQIGEVKAVPKKRMTGAVADIIRLHLAGNTKQQIISLGYNKNTVNRQVSEYIKKPLKLKS